MDQLVPDRSGVSGVGEIDHRHSKFDISAQVLHRGHRFDDVFVTKGGIGQASQPGSESTYNNSGYPVLAISPTVSPWTFSTRTRTQDSERTDDRAGPISDRAFGKVPSNVAPTSLNLSLI